MSKHMTLSDRAIIEKYIALDMSFAYIARRLNRSATTISREEMDTVKGARGSQKVLLTMILRDTNFMLISFFRTALRKVYSQPLICIIQCRKKCMSLGTYI